MHQVIPSPLAKAAFAPFGDVVESDGAEPVEINQGFATRFNRLAGIDVTAGGAPVNISLFDARPRPQPIEIKVMERHPLGSQLFFPLQDKPWLVLVCADPRDLESYSAFVASGRQGVNYTRNVWHHPLLVLGEAERFLIIDRPGSGNLEEVWLDAPCQFVTT
jgi:ureidoglycolate lyase